MERAYNPHRFFLAHGFVFPDVQPQRTQPWFESQHLSADLWHHLIAHDLLLRLADPTAFYSLVFVAIDSVCDWEGMR